MAVAVHHGGAGTVGATMCAGIPSVVVPFMSDQLFWARRLHELGVGTEPLPRRDLTASRLAERIRCAVTDSEMRERAQQMGTSVRLQHGVANALLAIRDYLEC
jgi:sterol 3beta-glucosyltransferase